MADRGSHRRPRDMTAAEIAALPVRPVFFATATRFDAGDRSHWIDELGVHWLFCRDIRGHWFRVRRRNPPLPRVNGARHHG